MEKNQKPKNKIKTIISRVLFTIIIGFVVVYAVLSIFVPAKVISTFGFQYFVIKTNSMVPVINVGDIVVLKEADIEKLEKNEIISFYADINGDGKKEVLTHYFDYTEEVDGVTYYRTKSEMGIDRYNVTKNDVIGLYNFKINSLGKVILFLREPFGIFVLVADIAIICLIVKFTKPIDKSKKAETNKEEKPEE